MASMKVTGGMRMSIQLKLLLSTGKVLLYASARLREGTTLKKHLRKIIPNKLRLRLPLYPCGYITCLDSERTMVQTPARSSVSNRYVIGLISRADTEGFPMSFLNYYR